MKRRQILIAGSGLAAAALSGCSKQADIGGARSSMLSARLSTGKW